MIPKGGECKSTYEQDHISLSGVLRNTAFVLKLRTRLPVLSVRQTIEEDPSRQGKLQKGGGQEITSGNSVL